MISILLSQVNEMLPSIGIGGGIVAAFTIWMLKSKIIKYDNHIANDEIHFSSKLCEEKHKNINEDLAEIKSNLKSILEKIDKL